jgi:hypothetical protein
MMSIKNPDGNVIHEARLPVCGNFQQRALNLAIFGDQREERLEDQALRDRARSSAQKADESPA